MPRFCGNDDNLLPAHHMISDDDKRHLKNATLPVAVVRGEEEAISDRIGQKCLRVPSRDGRVPGPGH